MTVLLEHLCLPLVLSILHWDVHCGYSPSPRTSHRNSPMMERCYYNQSSQFYTGIVQWWNDAATSTVLNFTLG
ncbi:unnamed protein product [Ixodes persulcatus]